MPQHALDLRRARRTAMTGIPERFTRERHARERLVSESAGGGHPDYTDAPDYDPAPHAGDQAIQCPSDSCRIEGGALNDPDAKYCDQCGHPLKAGAPAAALARRQAQIAALRAG